MQNNPASEVTNPVLTERELAQRLKVSLSLVRKWRRESKGPRFVRLSKCVRYVVEDVQRWLAEQSGGPTAKASPSSQK